ncbi:hypothetical protein FOZ63_007714, partial [Perkinsus olseni]
SVWCVGDEPQYFRTGAFAIPKMFVDGVKSKVQVPNEFVFEWRGSYLDLERENLKIELWQWSKYKANRIDAQHSRPLIEYATGPVLQSCILGTFDTDDDAVGAEGGNFTERYRVEFQLYFQEVYDFELHLLDWTLRDLPTVEELVARVKAAKGGYEATEGGAAAGAAELQHEEDIFMESGSEDSSDDGGQVEQSKDEGLDAALTRLRGSRKTFGGGASFGPDSASLSNALDNNEATGSSSKGASARVGFRASIKRSLLGQWKSFFSMSIRSDYIRKESAVVRWSNTGKLYYRGTLADADSETLEIEVVQRSKKHGLHRNT